jgi:hypothetical protein
VFLPSVPALLDLASQLEAERDHVLGKPHRSKEGWDDELVAAANAQRDEPGEAERAFTALGASAELDQVIFDGSSFGTAALAASEEEQEYLGLPGLLEPDQMRTLLRLRQERQLAKTASKPPGTAGPADPAAADPAAVDPAGAGSGTVDSGSAGVRERLIALRKELNALVALHHHRTGKSHGIIHSELRRSCGGPPTAMASAKQLQDRIATLRSW